MMYLLDAQLPYSFVDVLRRRGYDVMHTDELPAKAHTEDQFIRELATARSLVVVTKDPNFLDAYFLFEGPARLLMLDTETITNNHLLDLLCRNMHQLNGLFESYRIIELTNESYVVHE